MEAAKFCGYIVIEIGWRYSNYIRTVYPIAAKYITISYWRIESTRHSINPQEGHTTTLSLVLQQGRYSRDSQVERGPKPVSELDVGNAPGRTGFSWRDIVGI